MNRGFPGYKVRKVTQDISPPVYPNWHRGMTRDIEFWVR